MGYYYEKIKKSYKLENKINILVRVFLIFLPKNYFIKIVIEEIEI